LNEFSTLQRFTTALAARYGQYHNLPEFDRKAQLLNYELMRAMFEAFQTNKGKATGIIQWMLNAAWPKMYWQTYDWYLMPNAAFYAARKACQPLHLSYNYGDNSIYIINDSFLQQPDLIADICVLDFNSKERLFEVIAVTAEPQSSAELFKLPAIHDLTTTYFLALKLKEHKNSKNMVNNFYWLSTKPDILDYDVKVEPWSYYTPSKSYSDFSLLNSLPKADIKWDFSKRSAGTSGKSDVIVQVDIENTGDVIAFNLVLQLFREQSSESLIPVFWEDNYISLLPGEKRQISAWLQIDKDEPSLHIDGWNI
jgi:exo-1,4-beta-D-glucosaminidase